MPVLIARVGRERIYAEAVESHIGGWFRNAAVASHGPPRRAARVRLRAARPPQDDRSGSRRPSPSSRSPSSPTGATLEVPCAEPEVPAEARRPGARRAARVGRGARARRGDGPLGDGDALVIDLVEPDGRGAARLVVELGAGRLVEEIEQGARGHGAGRDARRSASSSATTASADATVRSRSRRSRRRCCRRSTTSSRGRRASSTRSPSCAPTSRRGCASSSRPRSRPTSGRPRSTRSSTPSSVEPPSALVEPRAGELLDGLVRSLARRGARRRGLLRRHRPDRRAGAGAPARRGGRALGRARARARGGRRQARDRGHRRRACSEFMREPGEPERGRRRQDEVDRADAGRPAARAVCARTCACARRSTGSPPR